VIGFGVIVKTLVTEVVVVAVGRVEMRVVEIVKESVSVDVKLTVVVEKTVFVYNVAVGLRLYD